MIRNVDETITMADIRLAVILGRPVTIDYERADGTRTVRVVEPFEVVDREHVTNASKRPFFRAMDRQTRDYRSFRFDRVYSYRVANASGRNRVPRPAPRVVDRGLNLFTDTPAHPEVSAETSTRALPEGWRVVTGPVPHVPEGDRPDEARFTPDDDWADWLESQYDPDAPVPYFPTPYTLPERNQS